MKKIPNTVNKIPLSMGDVGPGPGAERLEVPEAWHGKPEGVHTGGPWLFEGEVWKPLDAKWFYNAPYRVPTQEEEVLEEMAGKPFFPRNWRVEERNGRRWLVRAEAVIVPPDRLGKEQRLELEQAVRELNRQGWTIGDEIVVGICREDLQYFIVDLSAATRDPVADDFRWVFRFFEAAGYKWLVNLRWNAHQLIYGLDWLEEHPESGEHVYASFNRPVSPTWANLPVGTLYKSQQRDHGAAIPHTWIVTEEPLPEDKVKKLELTWAWSPLEHR
jgi:hypothetical protein